MHEYFDDLTNPVLGGILELLPQEEALPPCRKYQCKLKRNRLHASQGQTSENSIESACVVFYISSRNYVT